MSKELVSLRIRPQQVSPHENMLNETSPIKVMVLSPLNGTSFRTRDVVNGASEFSCEASCPRVSRCQSCGNNCPQNPLCN